MCACVCALCVYTRVYACGVCVCVCDQMAHLKKNVVRRWTLWTEEIWKLGELWVVKWHHVTRRQVTPCQKASSDTMSKDVKWDHVKRHHLNLCGVVYSPGPSGWSFLAMSEVNSGGAETRSTPALHQSVQGAPSFLRTSDSNPLPTPPPTFLSCANMHALRKEYNIFTYYF